MASDKKISELPAGSTPNGTELVPVDQSGNTVSLTTAQIADLAAAPTAANPSATAGPNAVNGVSAHFMRADASPAIQLGSASQPGLLQGDNSTVSINGSGVISIPAATTTQPGQVKVTGKSIKAAAGVISSQVPPAAIRGVKGYCPGSVGSQTVTFSDLSPAVPQTGDFMIINTGGGYLASTPAGWALISDGTGSNWQGQTYGKVLTAGDISTGSVTLTFSNSFNLFVGAVAFQGNTQGVTGISPNQNSGGGPSYKMQSLGLAGSIIGFISGRYGPTTISCSSSAFTLETGVNDGAGATGAIFFASAQPFFGSEVEFTFAHATSGAYGILIGVADVP